MKDLRTSRCCIAETQSVEKGIFKVNQIRASALLDKKYVESNIEKIINSKMLFIEGYFILGKYDIVEYLLDQYVNNQRKVAFNVSSSFICESKKKELEKIFNYSNYIFATEEEIEKFLGKNFNQIDEMCKAFHESLEANVKNRYLIILNKDVYLMVSSYDYTDNTLVTEYKEHRNEHPVKDFTGTREGMNFLSYILLL